MSKTFAIADIHGDFFGFADVLSKCGFREDDTLIVIGDTCDGGELTKDVVDVLFEFPNVINVLGNHDDWCLHWMKTGEELPVWWYQGGQATAKSYGFDHKSVPKEHIRFFENALPYYKDDQNRVFVHGGFDPLKPIETQSIDVLLWDRDLLCNYAPKYEISGYKHVYVGHTSTQFCFEDPVERAEPKPVTFHNLTGLDTGGGWNGRLSIMDIDTHEYWMSDMNALTQNEILCSDIYLDEI